VIEQGLAGEKTLLLAPVTGARVSSPFGPRVHPVLGGSGERMHRGLDFAATQGTPVRAAGDGTVVAKGPRGSYGHYVRIRHDDTHETAYAHLSGYAKSIAPGRRIRQGDVIGYVGSTGRSTGPHLHYEVLVDGIQVDPFALETSRGQPNRDGIFGVVRRIGAGIGRAGAALAATPGAVVRPIVRAASAMLDDDY
jgi:murein DD-endopeptidase MepM/ murein hydrolase activator NlpD